MSFNEEFRNKVTDAGEAIISNGVIKEEGYQKTVIAAMNYSLLAGGKRLRPVLMKETYTMFGEKHPCIDSFMTAIELIHTYSLVHDDLPAMDNDDYRRGKKTTHVVYGEDMAILAGDALLNYAYEVAAKSFDLCNEDPVLLKRAVKAMQVLTLKAGIFGMVGGQTVDVEAEDKNLKIDEDKLLFIFKLKTGALIQAAMTVGAILGGASEEDISKIEKIAENVGIAFQIQDDILDVTSTQEILGKPIGSDEKNNKTTYVTLKGLDRAKKDVKKYSDEANRLLESINRENTFLKELIEFLVNRDR